MTRTHSAGAWGCRRNPNWWNSRTSPGHIILDVVGVELETVDFNDEHRDGAATEGPEPEYSHRPRRWPNTRRRTVEAVGPAG